MSKKTYISNSVEQTEEIARKLGEKLSAGDVVAFIGGLGVGKTAFTRGLAEGVGVNGEVCSPTFALVHEYQKKDSDFKMYHFDMYRIHDYDDLYFTGFFDYLETNSVMVIEWSENIKNELPDKTIFVKIKMISEDVREIHIY